LKQVLDNCYKTIKEIRPNYRTCYNNFLEYCDTNTNYSQYPLREICEKHLEVLDIKQACKLYIEKSKKSRSIEAV